MEVCEEELYEEYVDASGQLVQFEDEQDIIDSFLRSYGTEENFLRAFGGRVDFPEPKADSVGHLSIIFSRPVVFPTILVAEYDKNYVAEIPDLKPTEEELAEIREHFAQF